MAVSSQFLLGRNVGDVNIRCTLKFRERFGLKLSLLRSNGR